MSENTKIEWADSTANPWIGCTKVSPGCKNCYAEALDATRFSKTLDGATKENPISHWGKNAPRYQTGPATWQAFRGWNKRGVIYTCKCGWRGTANKARFGACPVIDCLTFLSEMNSHRPRVFPSLCDWLDEEVPIEWLADFLKLIHDTPNLDWLLLTKRPENYLPRTRAAIANIRGVNGEDEKTCFWCPDNVWIGVSVEDQKTADKRLPMLAKIPAHIRFVSFEPLLEHIEPTIPVLSQALEWVEPRFGFDWAIIGGESGQGRRDCGIEAICDLADYLSFSCGIPTFVKQDCTFKPGQKGRIPDEIWNLKQFPEVNV